MNKSNEINPYAPPSAPTDGANPTDVIKWLYLTCAAIAWVVPARTIAVAASVTTLVLGLTWLHFTWATLRTMEREDISPAGAWARCFIPIYGYYWAGFVHVILFRDINASLRRTNLAEKCVRLWPSPHSSRL